jgi:hypothetical protein
MEFRIFDLADRVPILVQRDVRTIVLNLGGFGKLDSKIGGI